MRPKNLEEDRSEYLSTPFGRRTNKVLPNGLPKWLEIEPRQSRYHEYSEYLDIHNHNLRTKFKFARHLEVKPETELQVLNISNKRNNQNKLNTKE